MRPYRGVEYRKDVRRNLSKGWKADDTENFIFVYDIADRVLLSKLKHDLEVIRTKYLELFPPVKAIEAVSTVRICKDRDEFVKFAGIPKNAPIAGFWNVGTKELVFYNNVKDPTYPSASLADSVIVLYHEAFHQYIYYSCGEIAPHSWFNEGYGDYFSGAKIGDTGAKVDRINVNPWRIGAIQRAIKASEIAPLAELVKFTQAQYYAKGESTIRRVVADLLPQRIEGRQEKPGVGQDPSHLFRDAHHALPGRPREARPESQSQLSGRRAARRAEGSRRGGLRERRLR